MSTGTESPQTENINVESSPESVVEKIDSEKDLRLELVNKFIDTLRGSEKDMLHIMIRSFEFLNEVDEFKDMVQDKMYFVHKFLEDVIRKLCANPKLEYLRNKYIVLLSELFADTFDIGSLVAIIMKMVQEISKFRKMDGLEKKRNAKIIFDKLLDLSPMTEEQKAFAHQAFDGIVEAIIWAKHDGLKIAKKKCSKLRESCCICN